MILTVTLNASVDKLYLVEQVNLNTVMRVRQCINTAGGKGLNVSRVAAAAGENVLATGFVGGFSGNAIEAMLKTDQVQSRFVKIQNETRSCINAADLSTGKHTEFLEPGAEVTQAEKEEFLQLYRRLLPKCGVAVLSGSLPRGLPDDFYGALIRMAKQEGKKVILDTSGEPLRKGLDEKPTLVKPNADEIRQLFGYTDPSVSELEEAGVRLYHSGVEMAVVSLGKDGSVIVCGEGIFRCNSPDVKVVNTVGCGDSMIAGFAVGLERGYSTRDTVRLAVAASAANACTMRTGSIRPEDLSRLLPLVQIERVRGV